MYKCYPDSKRAHLKSGGNFPYLSRSNEVNLMIQVQLELLNRDTLILSFKEFWKPAIIRQ